MHKLCFGGGWFRSFPPSLCASMGFCRERQAIWAEQRCKVTGPGPGQASWDLWDLSLEPEPSSCLPTRPDSRSPGLSAVTCGNRPEGTLHLLRDTDQAPFLELEAFLPLPPGFPMTPVLWVIQTYLPAPDRPGLLVPPSLCTGLPPPSLSGTPAGPPPCSRSSVVWLWHTPALGAPIGPTGPGALPGPGPGPAHSEEDSGPRL